MQEARHWQIFIPAVNEYPFEKAKSWSYKTYAQSKAQVDKKRVPDIKARMPLKTAHYTIEMTFSKWCLIGPSERQAKSPMEQVLDLLKPVIEPEKWPEFKKQFKKKLLQQFEIIGWFKYATERIDKVNARINQLISEFVAPPLAGYRHGVNNDVTVRLDFVPHPETSESFYSSRLVELRSKIMEHFTGQPLDAKPSQQMAGLIQMDMHLDLKITKK